MITKKTSPKNLWKRQKIRSLDVDYTLWNEKRKSIETFAKLCQSCIFIVDVFKERYDFASENFSHLFGYKSEDLQNIRKHGDLLESRIHPDDKMQMLEHQIEHGQFIYSLPQNERNDYQQIFQMRMLNAQNQYVNVVSHHQVIEKDQNGKAWMIMGMLDISPDQTPVEKIKRIILNRKTGEILTTLPIPENQKLTKRETEILLLIHQGLLSKEISNRLNISIHTVNNHRKNILEKLQVDHSIEALNAAKNFGILSA